MRAWINPSRWASAEGPLALSFRFAEHVRWRPVSRLGQRVVVLVVHSLISSRTYVYSQIVWRTCLFLTRWGCRWNRRDKIILLSDHHYPTHAPSHPRREPKLDLSGPSTWILLQQEQKRPFEFLCVSVYMKFSFLFKVEQKAAVASSFITDLEYIQTGSQWNN